MRVSTLAATILALAAVAVAPSACKSNDIAETNSTTNVGGSTVGASGGIVKGPDGVELRIPAGALTKDVTFSIAVAATGEYPPLPGDFNVAGSVYALTPHGQKFLTPVVLSLPDPGGAGTTAIRAEVGGSWAAVGTAQVTGDAVELSTGTLSFYAAASPASASDAGHDNCSGRGPDNGAPTGKVSAMAGTYPQSGPYPAIDASKTVDGYATLSETGNELDLVLTPYAKACGMFVNGIKKIGAFDLIVVVKPQTAPGTVATGKYTGSDINISVEGVGAQQAEGDCGGSSGSGGTQNQQPGYVNLTALDASHITGDFTYTPAGGSGPISGTFDLPICTANAALTPPNCCVK